MSLNPSMDTLSDAVVAALELVPNVSTDYQGVRPALLAGLDPHFIAQIPADAAPHRDLLALVRYTLPLDEKGQCRLLTVLDNAINLAPGSSSAQTLTDLRNQILKAQNFPGFLQPPPTLPATGDYIAGSDHGATCTLYLPPLGALAPAPEDVSYVRAVWRAYQKIYQTPGRYVGPTMIPPANYMPGEMVSRRPPDQPGSTVQIWSLCETNQDLLNNRRLLVLGRPGIGKSSLLQFLAWQYANQQGVVLHDGTPPPDATLLPIVISLADWQDGPAAPLTLIQYIKGFLAKPPHPIYPRGTRLVDTLDTYLANPSQQSRLVFLLDDYNRLKQVDPAAYDRHWREIHDFATNGDYADVAIVVVSRSLDYDGRLADCDPPFTVLEISPWGKDRIVAYLQQNAPVLVPFLNDPAIGPNLLDLAAIPQALMYLITAVRQVPADLPRLLSDRQQMLRAFVDQLFGYSEQIGQADPALRAPTQQVLTRLADGLARDGQSGRYADRPTVTGYAGPELAANLDRLLAISVSTSILDQSPDGGRVGFVEPLLENYFAQQDPSQSATARLSAAVTSTDPATVLQGAYQIAHST